MKRVLCCGILAASVVAGYIHWRGNSQVYWIAFSGIGGDGWLYGPQWNFGIKPYVVKFSERRKVQETSTYTDIQFGSHRMRVKADVSAWISKLEYTGVMLGIGVFFFMVTTPRGWEKN
jgi:hypothetical protein